MEDNTHNQEQMCPLCLSEKLEIGPIINGCPPLQNVLFKSRNRAKQAAKLSSQFLYCKQCHFLFNPKFEESIITYDEHYNNNQLASESYRNHVEEMIKWLVRKRSISCSSRILEIGCGNGYFLSRLKSLSNATVNGYDPAYTGQFGLNDCIVREYFRPSEDKYDLIIIRSALEGMIQFDETMLSAVGSLTENGAVFIETISLDDLLRRNDFTGFFHEAARYFSFSSVQKLCSNHGLEVYCSTPLFGGLNTGTIAIRRSKAGDMQKCIEKAQTVVRQNTKIAVWGAAGRAISLLCQLGWDDSIVRYAVDIDADKQNKYMPITGQKIISPKEIIEWKPEVVIIANPNYVEEIKAQFDYSVEFITIDDLTRL
jgi:hypothetical protein